MAQTVMDDSVERWKAVGEVLHSKGWVLPDLGDTLPYIRRSLSLSDFVFQQILRHPQMWMALLDSGDLHKIYAPEGYEQRVGAAVQPKAQWPTGDFSASGVEPRIDREVVMQALRLLRRREMVRIAVRDICGWADLEQTMADLSGLADACIGAALSFLYAAGVYHWGIPMDQQGSCQQMIVLGLGKLGACELNFSSDVDLIFAYGQNGQTAGGVKGQITNEEFFLKLSRDLIHVIGHPTADGFVFRVDTRLRPYGDSGPLVMNFDRIEDYYQEQGREWERYALIKARVVSGDQAAGNLLLNRLKPFVFRRYLDYGAFDSLREMKSRIALEIKSKSLEDNIKLGPGGIREIEFFGQMFQLIRGGIEPALQIRPIRQVLAVLAQKGYIAESLRQALDDAYVFLRTVENRVQQWADQQVHQLPLEPLLRQRLADAMGYADWGALMVRIDDIRGQVHTHFNDLLAPVKEAGADSPSKTVTLLEGIWQGVMDPDRSRQVLVQLGYHDPDKALREITSLRQDRFQQSMSALGRERLNRLVPLVLEAVGQAEQPDLVLDRVFNLLRSIQRRASYFSLMLENPGILSHLVKLTGASPWIADFLGRHPVVLDELLDPRTLYRPPSQSDLQQELVQRMAAIEAEDLEYQMEALRVFKQTHVLRVAASDITHVLPLMKVSDYLSDIAEAILGMTVKLCWDQLKDKYGTPICRLSQAVCDLGFAVIAYGKLGGLELGYGSDLDLVFLHAAHAGETGGADRRIDNAQFFSRLGQRVLHMLTTHTSAGVLYEVDMRLRPSGDSGMLVSHVDGFFDYQSDHAWTWEHQALIRARAITGDTALQQRFEVIRRQILTQARNVAQLKAEVADMRARLRKEYHKTPDNLFDIKHGFGGIVDIEFLVQYLVLRYAHEYPSIVRWTDNVRLLQSLNEAGILDDTTAFGLRRAYLIYRAMVHRLSLRQQPAQVEEDRFQAARRFVSHIWNCFF